MSILLLLSPADLLGDPGQIEINQAVVNAAGGFPYVITQPGVYMLTGNLQKPAGSSANGIEVRASHVTLSLNGFSLRAAGTCAQNATTGVVTCGGHNPGVGILETGGNQVVAVGGGVIRGWTTGVNMSGRDVGVVSIFALENAVNGIQTTGEHSAVSDCSATRNGQHGISVAGRSLVGGDEANQNHGFGVVVTGTHSRVMFGDVFENRLSGMQLQSDTLFHGNNVLDNYTSPPVQSGLEGGNFCKRRDQATFGPCN